MGQKVSPAPSWTKAIPLMMRVDHVPGAASD